MQGQVCQVKSQLSCNTGAGYTKYNLFLKLFYTQSVHVNLVRQSFLLAYKGKIQDVNLNQRSTDTKWKSIRLFAGVLSLFGDEVSVFLLNSRGWGWCLDDPPGRNELAAHSVLPGVLYSATHQCRLQYGSSSRLCDDMDVRHRFFTFTPTRPQRTLGTAARYITDFHSSRVCWCNPKYDIHSHSFAKENWKHNAHYWTCVE